MGYHAVEWAYGLELRHAEKTVLAALCHRVDDETFETFVGQQEVARMIGSEVTKVRRALKALEDAGVLSREERRGRGGYRTSDLIRVNVDTYQANRLPGETPTRTNAYQANRRSLPGDLSLPTVQIAGAINSQLIASDHPERANDPKPTKEAIDEAFDQAYASWPKKEKRQPSLEKFRKTVKDGKRTLEDLTADVTRFGQAYAATTAKQYTPALVVWLNGERWTDDLPTLPDAPGAPAAPADEWRNGYRFVKGMPVMSGPGSMTREQRDHYLETQEFPNA